MSVYARGQYQVKNLAKYIGANFPTYRSSWELVFCQFCDNNPAVAQWASEAIRIPYVNPLTGKKTIYVPDFLIVYNDKNNRQHAEVVEIKPTKETSFESARSIRDKSMVAVNMAKWQAANAWCKAQGLKFRVITEKDIFVNTSRKK
jgi:hypothetical protein